MVAAQGGFHGRTMGALALTGQPAKQEPFAPLPGEVTHVPYGDAEALRAAVTTDTALVVLEPVQGENGVVVPPDGYLVAAREITRECGTLLVIDEIQTGMGRTGHWFACQAQGVQPDVITLAKGLGGGLPLGAAMFFGEAHPGSARVHVRWQSDRVRGRAGRGAHPRRAGTARSGGRLGGQTA